MENLNGKKALITGGSRGIGKAIAIALAKEGVDIAITATSESKLKETKEQIEKLGVKCTYSVFDVSDKNQVKKALEELQKNFGNFDILINNAGILSMGGILEISTERFEEVMQVNLFGAYYVTREVLPSMIEKQSGDIINISSTSGLRGGSGTTAYSASKFALAGLSESLTMEVRKHNIRVSTLFPSTIVSDMSLDAKITDGNPEALQPEDLAEALVWQLKLNRRALMKSSSLWATNP